MHLEEKEMRVAAGQIKYALLHDLVKDDEQSPLGPLASLDLPGGNWSGRILVLGNAQSLILPLPF